MKQGLAQAFLAAALLAGADGAGAQVTPQAPSAIRAARIPPQVLRLPEIVLRRRLDMEPLMPQWKAAALVRRTYPKARILRIRPGLQSSEFLVTLRLGPSLLRLRVNRRNGAIGI